LPAVDLASPSLADTLARYRDLPVVRTMRQPLYWSEDPLRRRHDTHRAMRPGGASRTSADPLADRCAPRLPAADTNAVNRIKVLCIDGGGIRGLIPAMVLAELERRSGRPSAELFDLVTGTSTGGIIACGLTRPGPDGRPAWRAEQIAEIYDDECPDIFARTLWWRIRSLEGLLDERFQATGLRAALHRYLGDAQLSEATTDLLIPAYETVSRAPFLFDSERARLDPAADFPLRSVALAASAGPTYFEAVELPSAGGGRLSLIDGGVYAVNPAMLAVAHVMRTRPGTEILLVSLGTGDLTRPLPYRRIRRWGRIAWARSITEVTLDGASHAVDRQVREILGDGRYWRFQVTLPPGHADRDDPSEGNRRALRHHAERLIAGAGADLDALAQQLAPAPHQELV
jgi:patatin-like phospholipase/acyl hydrolase